MTDSEKPDAPETEFLVEPSGRLPLVFISHDSRDAALAEAFGKLIKSVSSGMIKTFRSSDKTGKEGIDFGDEWFKGLMTKLDTTSDVVCLFTERSLDRPWILFEAGVAKGKLKVPVVGVALGVPLSRVTVGPFYQFQNMDDGVEDLKKLVHQLARRIPNLELDEDVVEGQVQAFKSAESSILDSLATPGAETEDDDADGTPVAKLVEELKALPSRVAQRLAEEGEGPFRRRRMRHFHPMMLDELMDMSGDPGDPVAILMAASLVRDDVPWLYELAMEVYRAVKSGDQESIENEVARLRHFSEVMMHGPFMEDFGIGPRESRMLAIEFPRMLEHALRRNFEVDGKGRRANSAVKAPRA
ncbi:MAG: toll/interleukin-1 receptor domain-containing protein [Acidimicrobiales bacterium]